MSGRDIDAAIKWAQLERLAGVHPRWWLDRQERAEWPGLGQVRSRQGLALNLWTRTHMADKGATRQAHANDCTRVATMARLLAADWLPARAVAYLDGLDEVQT
jgi:hypothetical protein